MLLRLLSVVVILLCVLTPYQVSAGTITSSEDFQAVLSGLQVLSNQSPTDPVAIGKADFDNNGIVEISDALIGMQLLANQENGLAIRLYSSSPYLPGEEIHFLVSDIALLPIYQGNLVFNDIFVPVAVDTFERKISAMIPSIEGVVDVQLEAGPFLSNSVRVVIESTTPALTSEEIDLKVNSGISGFADSIQSQASGTNNPWGLSTTEQEAYTEHRQNIDDLMLIYQKIVNEHMTTEERLAYDKMLVNSGVLDLLSSLSVSPSQETTSRSPLAHEPSTTEDGLCQAIKRARKDKDQLKLASSTIKSLTTAFMATGIAPAAAATAFMDKILSLVALGHDLTPSSLTSFQVFPSTGKIYRDQIIDVEMVGSFESQSTVANTIVSKLISDAFSKIMSKVKLPEGVDESQFTESAQSMVNTISGDLGIDALKNFTGTLADAVEYRTTIDYSCPITDFEHEVHFSPTERREIATYNGLEGRIYPEPNPNPTEDIFGPVTARVTIVDEKANDKVEVLISQFGFEVLNHPPELNLEDAIISADGSPVVIPCGRSDLDTFDTEFLLDSVESQPQYGTLSGNCKDGSITYTLNSELAAPAEELTAESLTVVVDSSEPVTISLQGQSTVPQDSFSIKLSDDYDEIVKTVTLTHDGDDSGLIYEIVNQPNHGTLSHIADNQYHYQQDPFDYHNDSFTYTVSDEENTSLPAPVTIYGNEDTLQVLIGKSSASYSEQIPNNSTIDFGSFNGSRPLSKAITIKNNWDNKINISSITVTGDENSHFVIKGAETSNIDLLPGTSHSFVLSYFPDTAGEHTGVLEIDSNDINQPKIQINLSGSTFGGWWSGTYTISPSTHPNYENIDTSYCSGGGTLWIEGWGDPGELHLMLFTEANNIFPNLATYVDEPWPHPVQSISFRVTWDTVNTYQNLATLVFEPFVYDSLGGSLTQQGSHSGECDVSFNASHIGMRSPDNLSYLKTFESKYPYDTWYYDEAWSQYERDHTGIFVDADEDNDAVSIYQGDCDDTDSSINPLTVEICDDGIDQDCDGKDLSCNEVDNDGDGFVENRVYSSGVLVAYDCNDSDPSIYYGAEEICGDGIDQDCLINEDYRSDGTTKYNAYDPPCPDDIDDDGDYYTENQGDCDDTNPLIKPYQVEICGDDIDQNCDGINPSCDDIDHDGDGFTKNEGDCDDGNYNVGPGDSWNHREICGDGIDQDCDGRDLSCTDVDDDGDGLTENEGDCNDNAWHIKPGAQEICGDYIDQDCDGRDLSCDDVDNDYDGFTENQGDCNDTDNSIYPGQAELCGDSIDQDCDGSDIDCNDIDNDSDGYSVNQGDCDDDNSTISPGQEEICGDFIDQDCDGIAQECTDDIDDDGDFFTENQGDCDDTDNTINPTMPDFCGDGIDQNCDGSDLACLPTAFNSGWWGGGNSAGDFFSLTIFDDGMYLLGDNVGIEFGTLSIDQSNTLGVHVVYDQNGDAGFSHVDPATSMTVSGDTLTLVIPGDGTFSPARVVAAANPLIGSWAFGSAQHKEGVMFSLTIYDDNTYIHCEFDIDDQESAGVEFGSYTYNQATQTLIVTPIVDQNGDTGPSGLAGVPLTVNVVDDVLTLTAGSENIIFNRVR